jgi:hypothetical protein
MNIIIAKEKKFLNYILKNFRCEKFMFLIILKLINSNRNLLKILLLFIIILIEILSKLFFFQHFLSTKKNVR